MSGDKWALAVAAVLAAVGVASHRRRSGSVSLDTPCVQCGSRAGTPEDFKLPHGADKIGRALGKRRFDGLYSLDVPIAKAKTRWPLVGRAGGGLGVLDFLDDPVLELKPGQVRLVLSQPVFTATGGYTAKGKKYPIKPREVKDVSFFSKTGKMNAPSFSLPAGPPALGGTCIAASYVPGKGVVNEEGKFVCSYCYAIKGHYIQHNVAFAQSVRLRWVLGQLRADPSGQLLAENLVAAMNVLAHTSTMGRPATRCSQEFGIWERGRVMVPSSCGTKAVALTSELPAPWQSTEQAIARLNPRDGDVAGFFRWHDSGDVNVGKDPALWVGYVRAIGAVARAFPKVQFWLPTRTYAIKPMREIMVSVAKLAPNLTIRPSAYMTCERPPVVAGLAAGTAVLEIENKKSIPTISDDKGRKAWACPVYIKKGAKSCLAAGCRACWLRKDVPVWYGFH